MHCMVVEATPSVDNEINPWLAAAARFDEAANRLGIDEGLQKVLREIDMRDLAVSLKTASEKLKTALLACISKRAAETVNEEISFMGALKLKDIEAAQMRIIEVVRRLESEGEIEIDSGKGHEGPG